MENRLRLRQVVDRVVNNESSNEFACLVVNRHSAILHVFVNTVFTTNVAGDSDNPVYVHRPITYAVSVKVEISDLSAHSDRLEQTFHVLASSWVVKAELNYDFYEKQRAQLSKLKKKVEAMLSKEDQTILPEIETFWYTT
ncbi:hypothetical protein FP744_10000119 [Trichoderma asperellum]